ncbi:MAG: 50S ribosomal protein L3 [Ignavibacteria bacterium]|nr:50S ribosomal protein L3 [Ignavibacteria bacterium]
MIGILGKKIGMTTYFESSGNAIPCTVVEAGPCKVTRIRTKEKDGYDAIQLGFGIRREKTVSKPVRGQYIYNKDKGENKIVLPVPKYVKEIREFPVDKLKIGDEVKVNIFKEGDLVKVTGISKGKGFQGVVKRHGFGGGVRTHGQSDRERAPGSIGASSFPSRVWKGQRMAGRMGGRRTTVRNLKIVKIIPDSNLMLIKGAIPGANSGYIEIYKI